MAVGFISKTGSDLDSIFAPGNTGFNSGYVTTQPANTGAQQNLGNRFAPLSAGGAAAATGLTLNGTDLNAYFAGVGTVAPSGPWPSGGSFVLGCNGYERFVAPGVTALVGRMDWQKQNINGSASDVPYSGNLVADRFNTCPGVGHTNANSWTDENGFVRSAVYGLTAGMVLRFSMYTDNLAGQAYIDHTVGSATEFSPGWIGIHSGGVPLCSNNPPYLTDPPNVFDFSPLAGWYFGMFVPYFYWANANYWAIRFACTFVVNLHSGTLNVARVRVQRIA